VTSWVPILTAFVAAFTASVGYFLTNRAKLVEERRSTYANALMAVESYKNLPYRIRRRTDSQPSTRGTLGMLISDSERDLNYYMAFLELDSDDVSGRFRALATNARLKGTKARAEAWEAPPVSEDSGMPFKDYFKYDDDHQIEMCKTAMRKHLRLFRVQ